MQQETHDYSYLNIDYIDHLCNSDDRLAKIIAAIGLYSIKKKNDSFQTLIEAIIYQQLNGRAR